MQHQILENKANPMEQKFFAAVAANDRDTTIACLQAGVPINAQNPDGDTALHIVLKHRHIELFHELMRYNPNVNLFNFDGTAIIHYAVLSGSLNAVKSLVNAGADIFSHCVLEFWETPLHLAIDTNNPAITEYLLEIEVSRRPNPQHREVNSAGLSPFIWAILTKKYYLLDLFIRIDPACLQELSANDETPIHTLIRMHGSYHQKTPSKALSKLIQAPGGKKLLQVKNDAGCTALHIAAALGCTALVKQLIEEGNADVGAQDAMGCAPYMLASANEHTDTVRVLIQAGLKQQKEQKSMAAFDKLLQRTPEPKKISDPMAQLVRFVDAAEIDYRAKTDEFYTFQVHHYLKESKEKAAIQFGHFTQDTLKELLSNPVPSRNVEFAYELLHHALIHKQRHVVRCIAESKIINLNQHFNMTRFLQTALDSRCYASINCLLSHGAHPKYCPSLIDVALLDGEYSTVDQALKIHPQLIEEEDIRGYNPFLLFILSRKRKQLPEDQQRLLLEKLLPKDPNKMKKSLNLAMRATVADNDFHLCTWLLKRGADANQKSQNAHLFHIAIRKASIEIAYEIFKNIPIKERSKIIKESSESFVCKVLRSADRHKHKKLRKMVMNILDNSQCSFQIKTGQLLHYAIEHRDYDLFKKYLSSYNFYPEYFTALNKEKQTVPEALISAGSMKILYLILDKLPVSLKKHIVNSELLELAKQAKHRELVDKLKTLLATKQESKLSQSKTQEAKLATGKELVRKAKDMLRKDAKEAMKLLHQAAEEFNNRKAKRWLGHCYRLGLNGEKDEKKSMEFYQASTSQEDFVAKCCVAAILDDKASQEYIKTIIPDASIQSSFKDDLMIFGDSEFHGKLDNIIILINRNKLYSEHLVSYTPQLLLPSDDTSEAKEKKTKPKTPKPTETAEPKYKPIPKLDQILQALYDNKQLKEPNRFISSTLSKKIKNVNIHQLIDLLFKHVCDDKWSIDAFHLSKIIQKLSENGLNDYADKFIQYAKDCPNKYNSQVCSAAMIRAKSYKEAKQIFEEMKEKRANLMGRDCISAMIALAMGANEYDYAKSVFEEGVRNNQIESAVCSAMIAAATKARDFKFADIVYQIAQKFPIKFTLHFAYIDCLIKQNKDRNDALIAQVYQHCKPFKYKEDENAFDLHDQTYGSVIFGLRQHFLKNKLNIIIGRGSHLKAVKKQIMNWSKEPKSDENFDYHPVKQAVIDLCKEFGWEWSISQRGGMISCYNPKLAPAVVFPTEVKAIHPVSSLQRTPQLLYSSFFPAKVDPVTVSTQERKIATPIKISADQLQRAKARLTELKALAKTPTEIQLRIIQECLEKIVPIIDNSISIKETFPEKIHKQVNAILNIVDQYSTASFCSGSQVLFLVSNAIQHALGLPKEKWDDTSTVNIDVLQGEVDVNKVRNKFRRKFGIELQTKYGIRQLTSKTFREASESQTITENSFLALPESKHEYVVYVSNPKHLIDAALKIVRPVRKPSEWIACFAKDKSKENSKYILGFFTIFKQLIKGHRYPEEDFEDFMSCFPSFKDAIRHPKVINQAIAQIKKLLLHGHADKFYQLTSACTAFNVIFPFMRDNIDSKLVEQLMKNTDTDYQRGEKPRLRKLVAQLLALNANDQKEPVIAMIRVIETDPLLKKIFNTKKNPDLELELSCAIDEVERVKLQFADKKQEKPELIRNPLLFRAHQQAIIFLRELKQDTLLTQAETNIKKFQMISTIPPSSELPDSRALQEQLNDLQSLFNHCIELVAFDRHDDAVNPLKDLSNRLIQFTKQHTTIATSVKKSIALMDNLTCLLLTFADNPERIQKAFQICMEMKSNLVLSVSPLRVLSLHASPNSVLLPTSQEQTPPPVSDEILVKEHPRVM